MEQLSKILHDSVKHETQVCQMLETLLDVEDISILGLEHSQVGHWP